MRCPKYTVLGISGSWGNVGFTPLLRSLAQTESILATSPPRVPAVWALPSPPHIASTPPSDHDPLLPRTLALHWSEHSPDSEARIPALAAGPQPDSHQEPQLCTPVRRGPLCLENLSSQDSFLSFKAVQVSPLPGSPLRSHHGTLQLPPHLTQHLWELSSYLPLSGPFHISLRSPSSFPLFLSHFAGCHSCYFHCWCHCPPALGHCSCWFLPLWFLLP